VFFFLLLALFGPAIFSFTAEQIVPLAGRLLVLAGRGEPVAAPWRLFAAVMLKPLGALLALAALSTAGAVAVTRRAYR
jgi:hypothetical protein